MTFFICTLWNCDQPIKNITASYQVMSSNHNIVIYASLTGISAPWGMGDSHVFCLVHCYVLCSVHYPANNSRNPPWSRVSFKNMTKHHLFLGLPTPPLQPPMHPRAKTVELVNECYINTNFFSLSRLYLWQGFESCFCAILSHWSFPGTNLHPSSLWI